MRLAEEIGTTKPVFFSQGWGPQRQANGEQTSRAIAMLPILTGNVGLPGTSTGQQEGNTAVPAVYLPVGTNPVKATIPCFLWTDAIVRGREMDDVHDGLRGVKTLGHDIKMIVNSGGNTLINQHSDSNRTDEILRDTSKCEFIVVCDNMMTPSARYADILLPDTLGPEADDVTASGGSNGDSAAILPLHKAVEPQWEQRPTWEICRGIARHLGKEEAFTEGKTQLEWIEWCYNETRRKIPSLPDFATFWKTGPAHIHDLPNAGIALEAFRRTRRPILSKLRRAGSRSTPSALRTSRRTGCFPRATSFRRFRCSCAPGRCRATHCRRSIRSNATVITATAAFTRPSQPARTSRAVPRRGARQRARCRCSRHPFGRPRARLQ
ncbi:MAG: molybdopterin-dependent oxidoreductase [Sutterella wadsworthensis]